MTVAELISKLQEMPQDASLYWDNSEGMEAEEVKSVSYGPCGFSVYKRIKEYPYWKYLGNEVRDVVLLSWREQEA